MPGQVNGRCYSLVPANRVPAIGELPHQELEAVGMENRELAYIAANSNRLKKYSFFENFHYLCVPKRKFFHSPPNPPVGVEAEEVDRIWEIK